MVIANMLSYLDIGINLVVELIMIAVIIIGTFIGVIITRHKNQKFNSRVLDIMSIIIIGYYILDLVVPIMLGKIYVSRVPFTIGTVIAPLIIISRFVAPFDRYKSTVAMMSIIAMFVFLLYPNPILMDSYFRFRNIQVFIYFGLCLAYGVLSIVAGEVRFNLKKSYRSAVCLILIEIWSLILKYLFISIPGTEEEAKIISPFLGVTDYILLPSIGIVVASFLMCLLVYGLDILIEALIKKIQIIER